VVLGVTRGYVGEGGVLEPEDVVAHLPQVRDRRDLLFPVDMYDFSAWHRTLVGQERTDGEAAVRD
jgi:hypothetical protein